MEDVLLAILLSSIAGLSTTIGSVIAFIVKTPGQKFLSFIMGFSAGVMILISFVELLYESIKSMGLFIGLLFFFLGMLIMFCIDILISHKYQFEDSVEILVNGSGKGVPHVHYGHRERNRYSGGENNVDLVRTSLFLFLGIFIHNLPEGMITFIGTIRKVELGIMLCLAIALHNIPEGITVAVPIYACTGSKRKAFKWSFISGMSEPLGAILVWLLIYPFINDFILSAMLGIVGGIMVYISLDELLPLSKALGKSHESILGIILGMFTITLSLVLLQ